MSPVRHVSSPRLLTQTAPGERPPGAWRYSSHLALVLSGGGARGAYHVGVLAGLAERLPGLEFPILRSEERRVGEECRGRGWGGAVKEKEEAGVCESSVG